MGLVLSGWDIAARSHGVRRTTQWNREFGGYKHMVNQFSEAKDVCQTDYVFVRMREQPYLIRFLILCLLGIL